LQQILSNVLSNAIKFTPEGGTIALTAREAGGMLDVVVKDSGTGIDAAFLPRVFDRFRQADGHSTRAAGGLGLGLSIVRDLVVAHGGSVVLASDGPGRGTIVTIRLPLYQMSPP
jgi:signal transduction histidine kinase